MVTSAPGMEASTVVRIEPLRSGETPPAQPVSPTSQLQSGAWWWEGGGREISDTAYLILAWGPISILDPSGDPGPS